MIDIANENMRIERSTEMGQIFNRFLPIEIKKEKIYPTFNKIGLKEEIFIKDQPYERILNLINFSILERPETNGRIDAFIQSILRDIPERRTAFPDLGSPDLGNLPPPERNKKRFSNDSTGLSATVWNDTGRLLTIQGKKVVFENGEYTEVDFTPSGRRRFIPSQMTDSLAKGVQGFMQMVEAIDNGEFVTAPVFVGSTNINMALIAQRLGFVIADDCRTPDGNINRDLKKFTVVGKLEDIKRRVEEFRRAGTEQKLAQRNQRLQLKPVPVG